MNQYEVKYEAECIFIDDRTFDKYCISDHLRNKWLDMNKFAEIFDYQSIKLRTNKKILIKYKNIDGKIKKRDIPIDSLFRYLYANNTLFEMIVFYDWPRPSKFNLFNNYYGHLIICGSSLPEFYIK